MKAGSFPEKYTFSHSFASDKTGVSREMCSSGSVLAKYFCPVNHKPVSPISSAASKISPNSDLYVQVYIIFAPSNINKILWKIQGANGVKTGYTGKAGKCLVSSIDYKGKDIIIVVLNCPDRWNVTEKIFNYIQETVAFQEKNFKELA